MDLATVLVARLQFPIQQKILKRLCWIINRADVIVTTGGLGPTSDDRTRDIIAEIFGRKLIYDENVAGVKSKPLL